jgi:hypothetical protein
MNIFLTKIRDEDLHIRTLAPTAIGSNYNFAALMEMAGLSPSHLFSVNAPGSSPGVTNEDVKATYNALLLSFTTAA